MIKEYNIVISDNNVDKRLDLAIIENIHDITRSFLKNNCISLLVNNKQQKLSYKCKINDVINIKIDFSDNTMQNIKPENIPINIIYEDNNYIVINKPYNMVVHPAKGNFTGTVVNALLGMKKTLSDNDDKSRIGIVHRLDKETSGLLLITKNIKANNYLTDLFKSRKIIKKYHAIVKGSFNNSITKIDNFIGRNPKKRKKMAVLKKSGKRSITLINNVTFLNGYSYLDITLLTGRTHQIRVHLSHLGYPILGDLIYSRKDNRFNDVPLCLVAYKLSFFDKFSDKTFDFIIDDPLFIQNILIKMKNN